METPVNKLQALSSLLLHRFEGFSFSFIPNEAKYLRTCLQRTKITYPEAF